MIFGLGQTSDFVGIFEYSSIRWIEFRTGYGQLYPGKILQVGNRERTICCTSIWTINAWSIVHGATYRKKTTSHFPEKLPKHCPSASSNSLSLISRLSYSVQSRLKPILSHDDSQCPPNLKQPIAADLPKFSFNGTEAFGDTEEPVRWWIAKRLWRWKWFAAV